MADNSKRKLIVHIGHQKTGTTTIQTALATGKITLTSRRILYPARLAHNYLQKHVERYALTGAASVGRPGMPGLQSLAKMMDIEQYDYAVISGEEFGDSDPKHLHKAMTDFFLSHVGNYQVLCYLRPHAARVLSSFAEQTKLGQFNGRIEEFHRKSLLRGRFLYAEKLLPWETVFGSHFLVRPMVRGEMKGGSVLEDFVASAFGAESGYKISSTQDANESLGVEDLAFLALVQRSLRQEVQPVRVELGRALAHILSRERKSSLSKTKLKLHRGLAEQIYADYIIDARKVDVQFFSGKPVMQRELERSVDEAIASPLSVRPEDHFSETEIRGIESLAHLATIICQSNPNKIAAYLLDCRAVWQNS